MAQPGKLIAEGKTKRLFKLEKSPHILVVSKNDITAKDGEKHDVMEGKAVHATATTCAVFELLKAGGIPTAFVERAGPDSFLARPCEMLPYEVVTRRIGLGSYIKRNPDVAPKTRFETLVVELFLKSKGRKFKGIKLPADDMYIAEVSPTGAIVYRPDMPVRVPANAATFIPNAKLYGKRARHPFADIEELARKVFLILEGAWRDQRWQICDLKIEFGYDVSGRLVVADVIDNDSWRLFDETGRHVDKQQYRDDMPVDSVAIDYAEVAKRVERFKALEKKPRIIIWTDNRDADVSQFYNATTRGYADFLPAYFDGFMAPELSLRQLAAILEYEKGDVVVITYSKNVNALALLFSAGTHVPVIAVPAPSTRFTVDVDIWSSLRVPTGAPVMTMLEPENATIAALGVLSARSPLAYMGRRYEMERRRLKHTDSPRIRVQ